MFSNPPTPRRILTTVLVAIVLGFGVVSFFVDGFSNATVLRLLQGIAIFGMGAALIGGTVVLALVHLAGWKEPESEVDFEALVQRSEQLAAAGSWGSDDEEPADEADTGVLDVYGEEGFRALVRSAVDELPLEFHRALEHVAIVISDGGRRQRAYGLYQGDTVARDFFHDRIVIFRDTLTRDFGHDPELLKAQVVRTVRHELAHHLGWGERGVRGLGL